MADYKVHIGYWTDWSKGAILGSRVTVDTMTSNILIAFTATYLTFLGSIAWTTLAYAFHQLRATQEQRDGLHHLQQSLLRNTESPLVFIYKTVITSWRWWHLAPKNLMRRTCSLVFPAAGIYTMFLAAGLVLSLLATTGDVLVRSPNCKNWADASLATLSPELLERFIAALGAWQQEEVYQVLAYAQECYPTSQDALGGAVNVSSRGTASNCDFYTKSFLNWTTSNPGRCPFPTNICTGSANDIIQFDTGLLDTNLDLGINDEMANRLQFRKVTTCSPLTTKNFSSDGFIENSFGNVSTYNYGLNLILPLSNSWPNLNATEGSDITFVYPYSSYSSSQESFYLQSASTAQYLDSFDGQTAPTFYPRPELANDKNRPVTLFFLANRALFTEPSDDPWFNPTAETTMWQPAWGNLTLFYNPQPGAVLGCVDEIYLCNPAVSANYCIEANTLVLNDINTVLNLSGSDIVSDLKLNAHQITLAEELANSLTESMMSNIVETLGSEALLANFYSLNGKSDILSSAISSKQWQVELQRFQALSLATLQRDRFALAVGPTDPEILQYAADFSPEFTWVCTDFKIRSSSYFSYSVLGLALLFGLGGLIMFCSLFITVVLPAIQLRTGWGRHRRDQWFATSAPLLLALVFNSINPGTWTTQPINQIPISARGAKFFALTGADAGGTILDGDGSDLDYSQTIPNGYSLTQYSAKSAKTSNSQTALLPLAIADTERAESPASSSSSLEHAVLGRFREALGDY